MSHPRELDSYVFNLNILLICFLTTLPSGFLMNASYSTNLGLGPYGLENGLDPKWLFNNNP